MLTAIGPPGSRGRTRDALAVNVGCNAAQLAGVGVAILQMDSLGRRHLALRSLGGVVLALLTLVAALSVPSLRYTASLPPASSGGISLLTSVSTWLGLGLGLGLG